MQCVSASMPVAAVVRGGIVSVNFGSKMATFGIRRGAKMTVFFLVAWMVTTPLRPTSLPVPAVVGMAIIGGTSFTILASPPIASSYCARGIGCVTARRTSLATSSGLPPPTPITKFASA